MSNLYSTPAHSSGNIPGYGPPVSQAPNAIGSATPLFWYEIDSIFSDAGVTPAKLGGPVQQFTDKSGNGNHATQLTAASQGSYVGGNATTTTYNATFGASGSATTPFSVRQEVQGNSFHALARIKPVSADITTANALLIGAWDSGSTADQQHWNWIFQLAGGSLQVVLYGYTAGSTTSPNFTVMTSSAMPPLIAGQWLTVEAEVRPTVGSVTFYATADGGKRTQVGSVITGTGRTVYASTTANAAIMLAQDHSAGEQFNGSMSNAQFDIEGATIVAPYMTATGIADATGSTWTATSTVVFATDGTTANVKPTPPAVRLPGSANYTVPVTGRLGGVVMIYRQNTMLATATAANADQVLFGQDGAQGASYGALTIAGSLLPQGVPVTKAQAYRRGIARGVLDTLDYGVISATQPVYGEWCNDAFTDNGSVLQTYKDGNACGQPAFYAGRNINVATGNHVLGAGFFNHAITNNAHMDLIACVGYTATPSAYDLANIAIYYSTKYPAQLFRPTGPLLWIGFQGNDQNGQQNEALTAMRSNDGGLTFDYVPTHYLSKTDYSVRDVGHIIWNGRHLAAHTNQAASPETYFPLLETVDEFTYKMIKEVDCSAALTGNNNCIWAPFLVVDNENLLHAFFVSIHYDPTISNGVIYETHPTEGDPTGNWSTPVAVTGSNFPAGMIDPAVVIGNGTAAGQNGIAVGTNYLVFKDDNAHTLSYATSTTGFVSGYSVTATGLFGALPAEGAKPYQLPNGSWIMFVDADISNHYYNIVTASTFIGLFSATPVRVQVPALMQHGTGLIVAQGASIGTLAIGVSAV